VHIAIFGASGHTARFVIAEVLRRGHIPIAIGRDRGRLEAAAGVHSVELETRIASLDSAESLDKALAGAGAVINCAGPFLDTARPLVEAALRNRVHYFDVTAEQGSALSTFELFDTPARARGIFVVPAAGFYGALGDVLATHAMNGWTQADRIDIAVGLDSWWPTRGTRRTGRRNIAPRLIFLDGNLTELQPSEPSSWRFAEPFGTQYVVEVPLTETILMARHLRAHEMHNYINQAPLRDLHDPATPGPVATDERGRSNQRFVIDAIVRNGDEEHRVSAGGRDIYAITAPIVVEAVERVCHSAKVAAGAYALGQLVDASEFLQALVSIGELTLTPRRFGSSDLVRDLR
jgi:hypothetical protein